MFRRDIYSKIEKSEDTVERKKLTSSFTGFRRDLYRMPSTTEDKSMNLSSLRHAQEVWKNLEYLEKEENPRIVHSQGLRWKGSEDWNKAWDAATKIEWEGRKVSTNLSKQRRSERRSR